MRWVARLAMALTLVAAGCGGSGEDVVTSFGSPSAGDFCGTLLTARVFISAAYLGAGGVSQEALDELARGAPEEIRADVETVALDLTAFAEKVGNHPTPFELEAALAAREPEVEAAEKRLDAWQAENC